MRDTRVINNDVEAGIVTLMHYDDADDSMTIEDIQNVEPLVEQNKALYNDSPGNWKGNMHRVASIPMTVYNQLVQSGCARDKKCMKRWLNDSDNRVFRTRDGRV